MNPIREKLDRMTPIEIGERKAELRAEAESLLAQWESEYAAATERGDTETRQRLFTPIRSLKADIQRRLQDTPRGF